MNRHPQPLAFCFLGAVALLPLGVTTARAEEKKDAPAMSGAIAEQILPLVESHRGQVAVAVKHLETGESFAHRADEPMPTASLIKLPVMITAYRDVEEGRLQLDQLIELSEGDKVPGSGILTTHFSPGTKITLRDAIRLMIAYSDNTATNLVVNLIGLPATCEFMESLGHPETKLHSLVYRRDTSIFPDRSQKYGLGSTTAADMIALLEQVHAGKIVSQAACKQMYEHLLACEDRTKIPRKLPEGTKFAHKTGYVSDTRTDAGIMETPAGPIAVCVLTAENDDRSVSSDNEAELLCAEIGTIVYRHFNKNGPPLAPTIARVLKLGSAGDLVESLQRTLNVRLDPSPELAVDGDFGPATESAVLRFQQEHKLAADGSVGPEMWRALGPLVSEDEQVPEPEIVNTTVTEKEPLDALAGQPYVTCQAWAIADCATGKLLWGYNDSASREPASTTKIMTAYVVARLAEADSKVLDEIVTFSERADKTSGSTSGIRAGEQVSVGDLLYGLLLPSGNDASVALAEHFGDRLQDETGKDGTQTDPYLLFVEAMNRAALDIGMEETHFKNTHGLPDREHKMSARDLAKLSQAAMQLPVFRQCVSTTRFGCKVGSLAGYERNLVWNNTNRLLSIEGYDGVKTGTTGAAGACLVSRAQRGDRELLLVVLGSSSSDARYADTRNLYRWAWNELGMEE
jgi:D-alanyl-D-alanine carboxypeptidase (penicillin-binding protein 5/6)